MEVQPLRGCQFFYQLRRGFAPTVIEIELFQSKIKSGISDK